MTQQAPKRNAAQRIEDLEAGMSQFYTAFNNLAADVMTIKEAVKLLGVKLDAVAELSNLSSEAVGTKMIAINVESLKNAVTKLIEDKILVEQEAVSMTSFVVAEEINDEGTVVRPRSQFAVATLPEDYQQKILGAKAGDVVQLKENTLKMSLKEIYNIQEPPALQEA